METPPPRPAGALLSDAVQAVADLVRGEIALARAEVEANLRKAAAGLGLLAAGAAAALVALFVLAGAAVATLVEQGLSAALSGLIVAVVLALVALVLIAVGRKALSPENILPRRTAKNVKRDASTFKEILSNDTAH
ncbi:phage holin family protein [Seohaeicola zhoushanensis]|nr:phage holin family protein [Seohaeicola zhoushanensis]